LRVLSEISELSDHDTQRGAKGLATSQSHLSVWLGGGAFQKPS
jgi:hypothetical protein